MAIIRKKELKAMDTKTLGVRLTEIRKELNSERGLVKSGGRSSNPGKIRELRKTVARILTFIAQKGEIVPNTMLKRPMSRKTEVKPSA